MTVPDCACVLLVLQGNVGLQPEDALRGPRRTRSEESAGARLDFGDGDADVADVLHETGADAAMQGGGWKAGDIFLQARVACMRIPQMHQVPTVTPTAKLPQICGLHRLCAMLAFGLAVQNCSLESRCISSADE